MSTATFPTLSLEEQLRIAEVKYEVLLKKDVHFEVLKRVQMQIRNLQAEIEKGKVD